MIQIFAIEEKNTLLLNSINKRYSITESYGLEDATNENQIGLLLSKP